MAVFQNHIWIVHRGAATLNERTEMTAAGKCPGRRSLLRSRPAGARVRPGRQPDGKFVKEVFIAKKTLGSGSVWDIAFSRDPQQKFLFLADGVNEHEQSTA